MEKIKIKGLYEAAYRAYKGTSFSPEKRAEIVVKDYEEELNSDLVNIPESERQRYTENYKKHLFAWLSAKSRCLSSMITGSARFPVERNRKNNDIEHRRLGEFMEWREKALKAIARKIEEAKPEDQKRDERFEKIKQNLLSSMATIIGIDNGTERGYSRQLFVANMVGTIKTLAKNGEAELVGKCLELIAEVNERPDVLKPVVTKNHSVWKLLDEAVANQKKSEEVSTSESGETVINGVRVVQNWQEDRLQLFFDGKPESDMIAKLKKNAFKWSPSRGCWQRQNTNNAIRAMHLTKTSNEKGTVIGDGKGHLFYIQPERKDYEFLTLTLLN